MLAFLTNGAKSTASRLPPHLRPVRIFPGGHAQTRDYLVHHYTHAEAAESIEKSGMLMPGNGHQGVGVYATLMHPDAGFSKDELKIAVRSTNLPDERVANIVSFDTDDLDRRNVSYKKSGNTVFIPTKEPLEVKSIAKFSENSLIERK